MCARLYIAFEQEIYFCQHGITLAHVLIQNGIHCLSFVDDDHCPCVERVIESSRPEKDVVSSQGCWKSSCGCCWKSSCGYETSCGSPVGCTTSNTSVSINGNFFSVFGCPTVRDLSISLRQR